VAAINFTLLSLGLSSRREGEVGLRKVMGAHRRKIRRQFLSEGVLLTVVASGIAVALVRVFLPVFNRLAGKRVEMTDFGFLEWAGFLTATVVLVGLAAGAWPAFVSARRVPALAMRSRSGSRNRSRLMQGLIVTQFVISITLLIRTVLMVQQVEFFRGYDPGYDREHVVTLGGQGVGREREAIQVGPAGPTGCKLGEPCRQSLLQRVGDAALQNQPGRAGYPDVDL
jgi:putative ABC transport system permease protein